MTYTPYDCDQCKHNKRTTDYILLTVVILCTAYNVQIIQEYNAFNTQSTGNASHIVMTDDVRAELNEMWVVNVNETIRCIYGYVSGDTYVIKSLATPEITYASPTKVTWAGCDRNERYLGTVHTHPSGNCKHSGQDYFQFGINQKYAYPDRIAGVVCGDDEYLFYSHNELSVGIVP